MTKPMVFSLGNIFPNDQRYYVDIDLNFWELNEKDCFEPLHPNRTAIVINRKWRDLEDVVATIVKSPLWERFVKNNSKDTKSRYVVLHTDQFGNLKEKSIVKPVYAQTEKDAVAAVSELVSVYQNWYFSYFEIRGTAVSEGVKWVPQDTVPG